MGVVRVLLRILFFNANRSRLVRGTLQNNLLLILPGSKSKKFLCWCQTLLSLQNPKQLACPLQGHEELPFPLCLFALVCVVFNRCKIRKFCNFPCQCVSKLKRILIMSHLGDTQIFRYQITNMPLD